MELDAIAIIIQGGAVGIAVLLIMLIWRMMSSFTKVLLKFNESVTRMEDNHAEIKIAIRENSEVIKENSHVLNKVLGSIK